MKRKTIKILLTILLIIPFPLFATEVPSIGNYIINLNVSESNDVNVYETIVLTFPNITKYNITRRINTWDIYTSKNKQQTRRLSSIEKLTSSESHKVINGVHYKEIYFGDNNVVLEESVDYSFKYLYRMGPDPYQGYDEFIFHLFDRNIYEEIKQADIKIEMPKDISDKKVTFWCDTERKRNCTNNIEYEIEDNILTASLKESHYGNLTVNIELEEGYFKGGFNNYGYYTTIAIGLSVLLLVASIIQFIEGKFNKYNSRKYKKIYLPPDNLTAIEIGFIAGEKDMVKLITASYAELAAKQYVKITKKNGRIQVTKVRNYRGDKEVDKILLNNVLMIDIPHYISDLKTHAEGLKTDLNKYLSKILYYRIYRNRFNIVLLSLAKAMILIGLLLLLTVYVKDFNPLYDIWLYVAAISIVVGTLISYVDKKKTAYGYEIQPKTASFKKTIANLTAEEIVNIVREDKFYNYKITPHAYALGILGSYEAKTANKDRKLFTDDVITFLDTETYNELYNELKNIF